MRALMTQKSFAVGLRNAILGNHLNLDIVYPSYRFFEKNPEYQRLFPEFKDVPPEELEKTNALYGHAKRVMKALENAVSALDDAESFSAYLEELGRRHKTRALKPTYLEVNTVNRWKLLSSPIKSKKHTIRLRFMLEGP